VDPVGRRLDPFHHRASRVARIVGLPIGIALLVGTLEFVGPNELDGWPLAGTVVPIAYIAWSLWLITLGVFLLI
jgi:hypothetical protein